MLLSTRKGWDFCQEALKLPLDLGSVFPMPQIILSVSETQRCFRSQLSYHLCVSDANAKIRHPQNKLTLKLWELSLLQLIPTKRMEKMKII